MKRTNIDERLTVEETTMTRPNQSEPPIKKQRKQHLSSETTAKMPSGIILQSGRLRLPDKLHQYLNHQVVPSVLYWQEGGMSFSFNTKTAQTELLDKYFNGNKLSSFTRSLNRWGFKRTSCTLEPKGTLSFEHPFFQRDAPELVATMTMVSHESFSVVPAQTREEQDEETSAKSANVSIIHERSEASQTTAIAAPAIAGSEASRKNNAASMISQLKLMGSQLQNLMDVQQERRREIAASQRKQRQQQIAMQAILVSRKSLGYTRGLQLKELDLGGLTLSSILSNNDQARKGQPQSTTVPTSNSKSVGAHSSWTTTGISPRENPTELAQQILLNLLTANSSTTTQTKQHLRM